MSDNAPKTFTGFAAWLPFACLALSAAAFGLGAPARIARGVHRSPVAANYSAENAVRDEPVLFPMPAPARLQRLNAPIFLRR